MIRAVKYPAQTLTRKRTVNSAPGNLAQNATGIRLYRVVSLVFKLRPLRHVIYMVIFAGTVKSLKWMNFGGTVVSIVHDLKMKRCIFLAPSIGVGSSDPGLPWKARREGSNFFRVFPSLRTNRLIRTTEFALATLMGRGLFS